MAGRCSTQYKLTQNMFQAAFYKSCLCLNMLMTWFFSNFNFNFWIWKSGKVNYLDTWWCNRQIKRRAWRIPKLCEYLYKKYGKLAELYLLGQKVLIVTDMKIASSLMTNHGNFLKQRFGNEIGLRNINMYLTGLIWNNNVQEWKRNRIVFEATLNKGSKNLQSLALTYLETIEKTTLKIAEPETVLEQLRNFTLSMTMEVIFGIEMPHNQKTCEWREETKTIIANYFKAWEFYLLNPNADSFAENELHLRSCSKMLELSQEIFSKASEVGGSNFISCLSQHNNDNGTLQCIAEMLLAGTDTSSLTMFYTLLLLADFPEIGNRISRLINSKSHCADDMEVSHVFFESMRLIPVGPAILRQCETDIKDGAINLRKGDGIIFNIAGMNRANYHQPDQFNPSRYQYGDELPITFGVGKKSCVGKTFAEKEMKIFLTWFLERYTVLGSQDSMVGLLNTRWDIANAPVNDIKLTIFPRIPVFFVGQFETGKSNLLELIKAEYPKIRIIDQEFSINCTNNDFMSCDYQMELMMSRVKLLNTFDSEFVLIEGSIVDCLVNIKGNSFSHDYNENELFGRMKNSLIVHFPYYKEDRVKLYLEEKYLQILKLTGCRFISLKSTTHTVRLIEVMNFIGNR